ncbi:MAG: class I SAM-dependent methyltransferase [candidate division Zixibacteria bacterium]|nr:class I SAM-dependent methyltransferase [candidate division Zixibacteria bacterium]
MIFAIVRNTDYYADNLAGERLRRCYEIAGPRIQRYLDAEIGFVLERISSQMSVLELGCGYGRVLCRLLARTPHVAGIDTAIESLRLARESIPGPRRPRLAAMDAANTGFRDCAFDLTICIQNGICAFGADQTRLMAESVRVTRPGGRVLFSSYSPRFWNHRLEWFEAQAAHRLLGEIDHDATGDGVIVCRDGFRAATMTADRFRALAGELSLVPQISEVDGSSVFCEIPVTDQEHRKS